MGPSGIVKLEVPPHSRPLVAGEDGLQHMPPVVGAVDIPRTEHGPFAVTELVEHEDGVIAHAAKVAVVGRSVIMGQLDSERSIDWCRQ